MSGFGKRLKAARTDKELTLEQLATAVDSSKAYIWQLENKDTATVSGELLMKLCAALNREPSYFLGSGSDAADTLAAKDILYRKFSNLTPRDQEKVLSIIEIMNDKESES